MMIRIALIGVFGLFSVIAAVAEQPSLTDVAKVSSAQLMACIRNYGQSKCGFGYFEIAGELVQRGKVDVLIREYRRASAENQEYILMALVTAKKSTVLNEFMENIAFKALDSKPDNNPRWFALQYFAEKCDGRALARLNRPQNFKDGYPIGCMWWQQTIRTFGKCRYSPAIPHLIESTNSVACLDISESAVESLNDFYPKQCRNTKSNDVAHDCFQSVYLHSKQVEMKKSSAK